MAIRKSVVVFAMALMAGAAFAEPPTFTGPRVVHVDILGPVVATYDDRTGLLAVVGADPVEACVGGFQFEVVSALGVFLNTGAIVANFEGEAHTTSIWPFAEFDCNLFLNSQPLATGTSQFRYTDNDLVSSGSRGNAYGWVAQGTLQDRNGAPRKFASLTRCIYDADTDEENCAIHVQLNGN